MGISNYEAVHEFWQQENECTLLSPSIDKHWEQIVLVSDCKENDYAIDVEITLIKGEVLNGEQFKAAGVIIRYSGGNRYYYAGLGGFGARTFIGIVDKQKDGKVNWNRLASQGKKEEIEFNKPYRLRVECQGAKISLYEDGKNRLSVEEETHKTGHWGLRTVRTQARFACIRESRVVVKIV